MANFEQDVFPTVDEIMQLVRSIVADTFPGLAGTQGRIFTNAAPFTLPFLNSAIRKMMRRLRNEGVTFPIRDGVILANLTPVVSANPGVFPYVSYNGYFDGTTMHPSPRLPGDLLQPQVVKQRVSGTNLTFVPMSQPQQGLESQFQGQGLGQWEWRNYAIYFNGSTSANDIMLRYTSGQPPIKAPAADFATTSVNVIDCQDAIANLMAMKYGQRNGGDADGIAGCKADAEEAIDEMALEYIRRQQTQTYRRESYGGGGSSNQGNVGAGATGAI